jgi:hypothetical protein
VRGDLLARHLQQQQQQEQHQPNLLDEMPKRESRELRGG